MTKQIIPLLRWNEEKQVSEEVLEELDICDGDCALCDSNHPEHVQALQAHEDFWK